MKLIQIFRKEKTNEFVDIQEQIWHNIHCVGRKWNKDDIIVTRNKETICVGQFSSYDVFIPTDYISFRELVMIKHYSITSISKYPNGFKIHLLSNRTGNTTTNQIEGNAQ
jgi:hypothetical protein